MGGGWHGTLAIVNLANQSNDEGQGRMRRWAVICITYRLRHRLAQQGPLRKQVGYGLSSAGGETVSEQLERLSGLTGSLVTQLDLSPPCLVLRSMTSVHAYRKGQRHSLLLELQGPPSRKQPTRVKQS